MPRIHVCSLARQEDTIAAARAGHLVSLVREDFAVARPAHIPAERDLHIGVSDINVPADGYTLAQDTHIAALLSFIRDWDRRESMVMHCFAGISRSTAAAFIAMCALRPEADERSLAGLLRERSPTASPNMRLVSLADTALARRGRMLAAIEQLGPARDCAEGLPFHIEMR